MLKKDAIYVRSQRRGFNTVDTLTVSSLAPQLEWDTRYEGGVEDQGNFREGFCFRLNRKISSGGIEKWITCADNMEDKALWMTGITNLIIGEGSMVEQLNVRKDYEITLGDYSPNQIGVSPAYPELKQGKAPVGSWIANSPEDKRDGIWVIL